MCLSICADEGNSYDGVVVEGRLVALSSYLRPEVPFPPGDPPQSHMAPFCHKHTLFYPFPQRAVSTNEKETWGIGW